MHFHIVFGNTDGDILHWKNSLPKNTFSHYVREILSAEKRRRIAVIPLPEQPGISTGRIETHIRIPDRLTTPSETRHQIAYLNKGFFQGVYIGTVLQPNADSIYSVSVLLENEQKKNKTHLHFMVYGVLNELKKQISELSEVKDQVGECVEAELVDGNWRELYSKYQSLQSALNQELSTLKHQLENNTSRKRDYESEIASRELSSEEYKEVTFSEEQLQSVRKEEKLLISKREEAIQHTKQAGEQKGKAEGTLESAKQSLVRFGEPLDKSEVGSDFDDRLSQVREERKALFTKKDKCGKLENRINTIFGRLTDRLKKHTRPELIIKVQFEDSFGEQYQQLRCGKVCCLLRGHFVFDELYAWRFWKYPR